MNNVKLQLKKDFDALYIAGEWVKPITEEKRTLVSPHDQSAFGSIVLAHEEDVDLAVAKAVQHFQSGSWANKPIEHRLAVFEKFNEIAPSYDRDYAELVTLQNGAPIAFNLPLQQSQAYLISEFIRMAKVHQWEKVSKNEDGHGSIVRSTPVGVVAAVTPWNAPLQSAMAKIIPALIAGCTVILKPTPETSLDALNVVSLLEEAGLDKGAFSVLPADREASEYLISHSGIDKIAFTGSTGAGRTIASIAGKQMKRGSFELGGKSAGIILDDISAQEVAQHTLVRSFLNNGQACIGLTRLLVPTSKYEEITQTLATTLDSLKIGNPFEEDTFLGPLFNKNQYEKVRGYIQIGIDEGATVACGGLEKPQGTQYENGWYVKPTLLTNVNNDMRVAREEIFGPVVVAIPYNTIEEAIQIANDSEYGLSGGVFTNETDKAIEIARQVRTGGVYINSQMPSFDTPFGGFKQSGMGREFGQSGLNSFIELQTIAF
ncbi:aldehyde dehydrogenase [Acinetobacter sp. V89_4]|uniref:aldehyde dehydrogenase n=1 Tax=Acinetobacter sp. V89_4 TaxID=3044232 RepID=UPI00249EF7CC|nr:aldehyde dehydrogenase [Acinetobacter sp. V89_4]MDI3452891.1 aldehyde dehydrogenase [Acinetobacter sp. V89_4]